MSESVLVTKEQRKVARRRQKLDRADTQALDPWQQYRALWDGIDFKRQVINMGDKKARFALVITGALNAGLIFLVTRGPMSRDLPVGLRAAVATLVAIYGVATFLFMTHVVEALRPRPEARRDDAGAWKQRGIGATGPEQQGGVGLIIRGSLAAMSFEDERLRWRHASLGELNAELILFNRSTSVILSRQLTELEKVYSWLKVLVVIATLILGLVIAAALIAGRAG